MRKVIDICDVCGKEFHFVPEGNSPLSKLVRWQITASRDDSTHIRGTTAELCAVCLDVAERRFGNLLAPPTENELGSMPHSQVPAESATPVEPAAPAAPVVKQKPQKMKRIPGPPSAPNPVEPKREGGKLKEDYAKMKSAVAECRDIPAAIAAIVGAGYTLTRLGRCIGVDYNAIKNASDGVHIYPYVERAFRQYFQIPPAEGYDGTEAEARHEEVHKV